MNKSIAILFLTLALIASNDALFVKKKIAKALIPLSVAKKLKSPLKAIKAGGILSGGIAVPAPLPVIAAPVPVYAHPEPVYAHPEPVYAPPAPVYAPPAPVYAAPHTVYEAPIHSKPHEPLLSSADILAVLDAVKQKAIQANPITKIVNGLKSLHAAAPVPVVVPSYKLVPSLGFTHYNKINYFPVIETHVPQISHAYGVPEKPVPVPQAPYPSHADELKVDAV